MYFCFYYVVGVLIGIGDGIYGDVIGIVVVDDKLYFIFEDYCEVFKVM